MKGRQHVEGRHSKENAESRRRTAQSRASRVRRGKGAGASTARGALRSNAAAVVLADLQGNLLYVSPSFVELWGYDGESEALGKPVVELWQRRGEAEAMAKGLSETGHWGGVLLATGKDGSAFEVEVSAAVVVDRGGKPLCTVAFFVAASGGERVVDAMELSDHRYKIAIEEARDGILLMDPDGVILDANRTFVAAVGYDSKEEVIGMSIFDIVAIETPDELRDSVIQSLGKQGYIANVELVARSRDGREIPVEVNISQLPDEEGRQAGAVVVIRDITERKRAEDEVLRHSKRVEALYAISLVVSQTLDLDDMLHGVLKKVLEVTELEGGYIHFFAREKGGLVLKAHRGVSEQYVAAVRRIEVEEEAVQRWLEPGSGLRDVLPQPASKVIAGAAQREGVKSFVEVPLRSKSGLQGAMTVVGHAPRCFSLEELDLLRAIAGEIAVGIENARLLEQTRELSITDELTKLYNRRHFYEVLQLEIDRTQRYGRPFTLAMLDLDGFKEYNDRFGHSNGDGVLKSLAVTLRSSLRKSDIAFRYGGDEFIIVLPATDAARARRIVDRIRSEWLQAPKAESAILESPLGFSAGIAQFPDDAETGDGLILLADAALYRSKRGGGYKCTLVSDLGVLPMDFSEGATLEQVYALAAAVDGKDQFTYGHSKRVADMAELIGRRIGLEAKELSQVRSAALLHDIGKVGVPDAVIIKPDRLGGDEWRLMQTHASEGARIVGYVEELAPLVPMILHHHERYDGTGYPDGLAGEDIPLGARIISIVDAYDTMTTPRPYRDVLSPQEASKELRSSAGTQFDPELVGVFCRAIDKSG